MHPMMTGLNSGVENLFFLENEMYTGDIQKAIQKNKKILEISNKTIFITGATGLIGSSIIDVLLYMNRMYNANIKILAGARDEQKVMKRFPECENLFFIRYDANKRIAISHDIDYIVHGASNASPNLYVKYPVETMDSNFNGMRRLLELGRVKNVINSLFISSSEVYGKVYQEQPLNEEDYGEIDILDVRSSYSNSKRATETLCISVSDEYKSKTTIVRPGHIYGPSAKLNDMRVSSSFIREAAFGNKLTLKSAGTQIRSYMYSIDCAVAILYVLFFGKDKQAYNISNPNSIITIKQMADMVAEAAKVDLDYGKPSELDLKQANVMMNASLCSKKLEDLGWSPAFNRQEGLEHSVMILRTMLRRNKSGRKQ